MRVVIAGGSGFLGGALSDRLLADGHQVVLLSREAGGVEGKPNIRSVRWAPNGDAGAWASELDGADAVVNLAGASLADGRWTDARKQVLIESRLLSTRSLANAMRTLKVKPPVFVQGSAMGFYGAYENGATFDESSSPGLDFLAQLCVGWEAEAHPMSSLGCRVVFIRSGIVLSKRGGALRKMMVPFKLFVGGRVASGRQWMSWIHLEDWVGMIVWAINTPTVTGAINAVAPNPVVNAEFVRSLGHAMHRPALFPAPAFMMRLVFGEMADAMLNRGQRLVPKRALDLGYKFRYERVDEAMKAAVS